MQIPKLLKDVVSTVAPVLGTALGGPAGGLVLSMITNALGFKKDSEPTSDDLINAIQTDPAAQLRLKQLQNDHAEELAKIEAQNYQTEVEDRKSARNMAAVLKDHVHTILAVSFVLIYAVVQIINLCMTIHNDLTSARVQDIMVMIISFYFGSSIKQKTQEKLNGLNA